MRVVRFCCQIAEKKMFFFIKAKMKGRKTIGNEQMKLEKNIYFSFDCIEF